MMQEAQHEHAATNGANEGEGAEGAAHEGHAEHEPADINWVDFGRPGQVPYIANLINFAILLWIFWRFGKEPIAKALTNRRETIKREIDEAQRIKKEAQARAKKYQKRLEHLDADQQTTEKALVEAGNADKQRILHEAEEKAARMERDAKLLLESEIAGIKQDLTRETVDLAVAAAEDLLRASITASDHERLAEDFLKDLAARNSKNRPATAPPSGPRGSGSSGSGPSSRPPIPRPASVPPRPASIPPRAQTSEVPAGGGSES
ncbi:MAG TPA: ATP synthase F0 subunit B [Polyangiaceae bacterium]|nr:ATP synthase F0 subunit B [Polyangiaceae bacterium]